MDGHEVQPFYLPGHLTLALPHEEEALQSNNMAFRAAMWIKGTYLAQRAISPPSLSDTGTLLTLCSGKPFTQAELEAGAFLLGVVVAFKGDGIHLQAPSPSSPQ